MADHKPMLVGTYIYLRVVAAPGDMGRKTAVWDVCPQKPGKVLGQIEWFGAWRCYVFKPAPGTLFEPTCLHEIAVACSMATHIHRSK